MALQYRVNDDAVSHNEFDGEVVVIDFETGSYYSMRGAAASIWRILCDAARGAAELVELFVDPPVAAAEEIGGFLGELAERGLVVEVRGAVEPGPSITGGLGYEAPTLEAFEDLQALLVADVIHDVDEQGWPNLITEPKT